MSERSERVAADPEREARRDALRSGMSLALWAARQPAAPAVVTSRRARR